MKKNVLITLSGGMDSATLLYYLLSKKEEYDVSNCVNFYYGSKHNKMERKKARKLCKQLKLNFISIDISFINKYFKSSLLKSGNKIPDGHYADENMKKTVVPFRNGIMLSIAAGLAESLGLDTIALGNHSGDHAIYPDCREDFTFYMSNAIKKGTWKNIELITPFLNKDKREIVAIGQELSVPYEDTYTCYKGEEKPCGKCGSCVERLEAFMENGLMDPLYDYGG